MPGRLFPEDRVSVSDRVPNNPHMDDVAAGKSPLEFFFVKDVSANATLDLVAADVDAGARFGLVDLQMFDVGDYADDPNSVFMTRTLRKPETG